MEINPDFVAPCGLYCGVCAIYIAHRDNNEKFKERLVNLYKGDISGKGKLPNSENFSTKDIRCRGCLSDDQFMHCRQCEIRDCNQEKDYTGCHECDEFPCRHIGNFPMTIGKRVILRAIPYWREAGTEKWIQDEEARYIKRLVEFFRDRNIPVIHILTTEWTKKHLPWNIQKLYDENPEARFYHEGMPEAIITPLNNELVVRKNMPSAFGGTDYIEQDYLYNAFAPIRHITICGFYSTGCVHETIIEGFNRYKLFFNLIQDCCETFDDPERQTFQKLLFNCHFKNMNGHVLQLADLFDI